MTSAEFIRWKEAAVRREQGCKRMALEYAGNLIGLAVLAEMASSTGCGWRSRDFSVTFEGQSTGSAATINVRLEQAPREPDHIGVEIPFVQGNVPARALTCAEVVHHLYRAGWALMPIGRPDWRMQVPRGPAVCTADSAGCGARLSNITQMGSRIEHL